MARKNIEGVYVYAALLSTGKDEPGEGAGDANGLRPGEAKCVYSYGL